MKIYLHIGKHKTGTTAIQHFCMGHRDLLARHGIFWPNRNLPRHPNQHSYLAHMMENDDVNGARLYIQQALADAEAAGAHSLGLSGEGLSRLDDARVEAFLNLFTGYEVEVIVYFRNIRQVAISMLHQRLKGQRSMPDIQLILDAIHRNLDYTALLTRWERALSKGWITVRCYDREKNRLIASFLEILGIPESDVPPITRKHDRNRSIDLATQFMLAASGANYRLHNFGRVRDEYHKLFDDHPFFPPTTEMIAEALCAGANTDVSHPLLADHRELLLAPLKVPDTPSDPLEYLSRLSTLLSRTARRERWRRRIQRLFGKTKLSQ